MGKSTKRPVIVDKYPAGTRVGYIWPGGGLANSGFDTVERVSGRSYLVMVSGLKFNSRGEEISKTGANRLLIDAEELERLLHAWNRDQKLRLAAVGLSRALGDLVTHTKYIEGSDTAHDILIDTIVACTAVLVRAVHGAE